jgi:glycosyltransferase involved in cell wall biosynthesis
MGDPLIGDLLSCVLVAALLYLFYYSFTTKSIAPLDSSIDPSPPVPDSIPIKFFIEPSPIPGQMIPYPIVTASDADLNLSIVVPVRDFPSDFLPILSSICDFFDSRAMFSYEVIVVDVSSTSVTHDIALEFALEHSVVRVLRVPASFSMSAAVSVAGVRSRGRRVFVYNPCDDIAIEEYAFYEGRMERHKKTGVMVGQWLPSSGDRFARSTLSLALEGITHGLLRLVGVPETAVRCARTFLIGREAAEVICAEMRDGSEAYALEILMAAARNWIEIRAVRVDTEDVYAKEMLSLERMIECRLLAREIIQSVVSDIARWVTRAWSSVAERSSLHMPQTKTGF